MNSMRSDYNFSKVINTNPDWYCGDFHVHTNASIDGVYPPSTVAEIAKAEGLDFIAITDHNTIEGYSRLREELDLIVIPGLEVTLDKGHFNVFGINEWHDWMVGICGDKPTVSLPNHFQSVNKLISQIAEQGLLNSINHPLLDPWAWLFDDTDLRGIQCIELWNDLYWPQNANANPKAVNMWTKWLNANHRITAIGGSDYHYPPRPEESKFGERLGMPKTYVYAEELSGKGILEGLVRHKAYVTQGPQVIFQAEVNGESYTVGDDLGIQEGEVRFSATILYKPVSMEVNLVKNGQILASGRIKGKEANLEFQDQVTPNQSAWYRLDIYDLEEQVLAITNPIFCGPHKEPTIHQFRDFNGH